MGLGSLVPLLAFLSGGPAMNKYIMTLTVNKIEVHEVEIEAESKDAIQAMLMTNQIDNLISETSYIKHKRYSIDFSQTPTTREIINARTDNEDS